jgi:hypothetical protein
MLEKVHVTKRHSRPKKRKRVTKRDRRGYTDGRRRRDSRGCRNSIVGERITAEGG